jgi:hypothetical protein
MQNPMYQRIRLILLFIGLGQICLFAEGTRQLAPNSVISLSGSNDIAALHIDNNEYNNFASYNNADPTSRLYIHINDPASECIYMGFSFGHLNQNTTSQPNVNYEYRVRDPNGNVVFGPIQVPITGANINNWSEAVSGPAQLSGAGGYNAMFIPSAALGSQGWNSSGDYFVEFRNTDNTSPFLIDFWDITVADCSAMPHQRKPGRVWSYNWAIFAVNDFGFPNRPFNGSFYVCAPDPDNPDAAFITKIDFDGAGFRPAAFNIAVNSFGAQNTGDVAVDRQSVELTNSTQAEYAIYLNDPVDNCETATVGEVEIVMGPSIV